ncbi:MAG: hypothetical protein M3Z24_14305, partial [Chloroflexota bacterium]|nr:hypothetical protein [Chloroflexota bacterium]
MNQENMMLVTAHPEFLDAALNELKHLDKELSLVKVIVPGIALCTAPQVAHLMRKAAEHPPTFVRHLAPVQTMIELTNTEQDIGKLAIAIAGLPGFSQLGPGQHFAVQTRLVQTEEQSIARLYSSG